MKRRKFISQSVKAGIITGAGLSLPLSDAFSTATSAYDLVAVMGGEPAEMFDKAIAELGGMKTFVKPGQTVVVKPNIGWDAPPERAANTNPALVKRVIEHCIKAGAKTVYVFDKTCNNWMKCYKNSGIEDAAKEAGAKVVPGNTQSYYRKVEIPKGKRLKEAEVHELVLDSDVFINIPILKNHGGATLSLSMKNLMGVVWDRQYWHDNDLHQCIADFPTFKKPDLNIIDGYNVLKRNGPRGVSVQDVVQMKAQIVSTDIVAADAAATKLFGLNPEDIGHIKIAHEMGLGNINLDSLNIKRIKI